MNVVTMIARILKDKVVRTVGGQKPVDGNIDMSAYAGVADTISGIKTASGVSLPVTGRVATIPDGGVRNYAYNIEPFVYSPPNHSNILGWFAVDQLHQDMGGSSDTVITLRVRVTIKGAVPNAESSRMGVSIPFDNNRLEAWYKGTGDYSGWITGTVIDNHAKLDGDVVFMAYNQMDAGTLSVDKVLITADVPGERVAPEDLAKLNNRVTALEAKISGGVTS
jgi:hypothetical protein